MTAIKTELENAPSLVNYDYKAWDEINLKEQISGTNNSNNS